MKKPALMLLAVLLLAGTVSLSGTRYKRSPDLVIDLQDRNPFTHLRVAPQVDFQFAIVSDRTGGHRGKVFSQAVQRLNLLQPEFVLSVGDLIEGNKKSDALQRQWKEFDGYVQQLSMPFFYVAGNHDVGNADSAKFWAERFGRRHYHFVHRNVLFLMLNSNDPPGTADIGKEQVAWVRKTLDENKGVRWTLVFLHHPLWLNDPKKSNWKDVEDALGERPCTVFCGHRHFFQKWVRNGRNYYQLATTGGVSKLRGVEQGEFDQIAWVTMKKDGPVIANILLDAILPEDLKPIESDEPGVSTAKRPPLHPVRGKVLLEGVPIPGALVVLDPADPKAATKRAEGLVQADGTFTLTTFHRDDGAVAGEYIVTIAANARNTTGLNKVVPLLPERFTKAAKSELRATIRAEENVLLLELKK